MGKFLRSNRDRGVFVGSILPLLAKVETMRRHEGLSNSSSSFGAGQVYSHKWMNLLDDHLLIDHHKDHVLSSLINFWQAWSGVINNGMDFDSFMSIDQENSNPRYAELLANLEEGPEGFIIRATGNAGVSIYDPLFTYMPFLETCKKKKYPVVICASSDGEVAEFFYGAHAKIGPYAYFAGTMDAGLISPKLALYFGNLPLIQDLMGKVESKQDEVLATFQRQFISGNHFRSGENRQYMQDKFDFESRVGLIDYVHAMKGIVGIFLHSLEVHKPYVRDFEGVLKNHMPNNYTFDESGYSRREV